MRKIYFLVAVLYSVVVVFSFSEEPDFPYKNMLNIYRDLKSREFALTGQKITPAIMAYWEPNLYRYFSNDKDPVIFVLHDDYVMESVKKNFGLVQFNGAVYGDIYLVRIIETVIGLIQDNQLIYSYPSTFSSAYQFLSVSQGSKLGMENNFDHYYILEKDVPLLLERLKAEEEL
ncbi:MAG: hypothetical protein LBV20_05400 [Treponema sp.]|jgi:hypothetical protein|nr:hypothetical protein [Treponema sp.]